MTSPQYSPGKPNHERSSRGAGPHRLAISGLARTFNALAVVLAVCASLVAGPTNAFADASDAAASSPSSSDTTASPEATAPTSSPTDTTSPAPSDTPTASDSISPAPSPADTATPPPIDAVSSPAPSDPSPSNSSSSTPADTASPSSSPSGPMTGLILRLASGLTDQEQAAVIESGGGTETGSVPALRLHFVDVLAGTVGDSIQTYQSDPGVVSVDRDRSRDAEGAPSDPAYGSQWGLPQIGWDQAYGSVNATGSATIAVLDTGVDGGVADLSGQLSAGWSAFGKDPANDPNGHGTWLASIAAAETDNGSGIAGVDYAGATILPVQVLDPSGQGQDSDIISGVVWAADHGADVILMGFSNPGYSQALQDAVDYTWSKGAVLVAATGNDGSSVPTYPAGDAKVMGVSATDQNDALAGFSNSGADTFLAAPGVGIEADAAGGGTTSVTGTSASAAMVAGTAALLKSNDPSASNAVIDGRLARNADPAGTASSTGNGRLNLARALADTSTEGVTPAGAPGGGPLVGPYVITASTVNSATLDGASSVTVAAGATISAAVSVTSQNNNANNRVGSIGWRIATTAPGTVTCIDVTDVQNATATRAFNVAAPATNGTYNAYFIAYSDNVCASNPSNTLTLSNAVVVAPANPVPTTTTISPDTVFAGNGGFTLTVDGTNFVANSVVRLNGADRTTTFVTSTRLTAAIPGADVSFTGTRGITVFNPTPGGGTSNGQTLTIVPCTNKICIDGSMADWAALTTTPSYGDNPADQGGGSTDITAIRLTAGDGNLYVRWDETLTSNKNKIASDGFSITVDVDRDGTPDARGWVLFDSQGFATVQVERPFGTFVTVGAAQQTCNVVVCAPGAASSI
jgi:hypothetical protein